MGAWDTGIFDNDDASDWLDELCTSDGTDLYFVDTGRTIRKLTIASIDHAMWFHRPARVDEWLLYATDSPSASGARGLARGSVFSRDGRLVASTSQEGLLRVSE